MLHRSTTLKGFRHYTLVIWELPLDKARHQGGAALAEHQMVLQRRYINGLLLAIRGKTADLLERLARHNDPQLLPKRHGASGMCQTMAIRGHHGDFLAITGHQHTTQGITGLIMRRRKNGAADHL